MLIIVNVIIVIIARNILHVNNCECNNSNNNIIARNVLILNICECNNRKYTLVFSKAVVPL